MSTLTLNELIELIPESMRDRPIGLYRWPDGKRYDMRVVQEVQKLPIKEESGWIMINIYDDIG